MHVTVWHVALSFYPQRLRERLERLNLDMLIVAGDGNCQVAARALISCTTPPATPARAVSGPGASC